MVKKIFEIVAHNNPAYISFNEWAMNSVDRIVFVTPRKSTTITGEQLVRTIAMNSLLKEVAKVYEEDNAHWIFGPDSVSEGSVHYGNTPEAIFQSPDSQNEVYVYTTLFSGNGTYRYVRFVCVR